MADQVDVSGGAPGPASQTAGGEGGSQFGLTLVFSILFIWYSRNTGQSFWVYWAPFFLAAGALLLGIPVYLAQRRHMGQPEAVPPYR
jgi:hypothetical protein